MSQIGNASARKVGVNRWRRVGGVEGTAVGKCGANVGVVFNESDFAGSERCARENGKGKRAVFFVYAAMRVVLA